MLVSILETIVSSDNVVDFEPRDQQNAEQKEALKLATRAVHEHVFAQDGIFDFIRDTAKGGLIEVMGHALVCYDKTEKVERLPIESEEDLLAALSEEAEIEGDVESGEPLMAVVRRPQTKFTLEYLPGNEVLVAKDAKKLGKAFYAAHVYMTTISELREQGYKIDDNIGDNSDTRAEREDARDGKTRHSRSHRTGAMRSVAAHHEFIRYDYDGDGIAEMRQVLRVGSQILLNKEIDFGLMEEWCPMPIPGRRVGESLAEVALETERARTTLLREALDNYGHSNRPRLAIGEGAERVAGETMDDLQNWAIGHPVRVRDASQITPITIPFTSQHAFTGLEFLSSELEKYTGVTQMNQGLDRDAIHDTASGAAMQAELGQQIELYVTREYVEFLGRVFQKLYNLMRVHGDVMTVTYNGQEVDVDPKTWPEGIKVRARAGLGSGKRRTRVDARMALLQVQQQGMEAGLPIKPEHIYNNVSGLVADMGLGEGRDYWPTQDDADQQEKPPSPEEQKVELEKQIAEARLAADQAKAESDAQLSREKFEHEKTLANSKAEFEADLAERRSLWESEQSERQFQAEAALEMRKLEMQHELQREQMARDHDLGYVRAEAEHEIGMTKAKNDVKLKKNRPGGSLVE
jgi:hypothetical protein